MNWLENIVDNSLEKMMQSGILTSRPDPHMPIEMIDHSRKKENDWIPWKPIKSIITDENIADLEHEIGCLLPFSFNHYLKYKHFYFLRIPDNAINLFAHLPDTKLGALRGKILNNHLKSVLLENGFIHFANFHDYGFICFNANVKRTDNEYPVVYIEQEDPSEIYLYADNFKELMQGDAETGNRFIIKLNNLNSSR